MFDYLKNNLIDKETLLIINFKKLNLSDNQALILLLIMKLSKDKNVIYTSNDLSNYLNLETSEIESNLSDLIDKKFIVIQKPKKNSEHCFNLDNVFKKIIEILEQESVSKTLHQELDYVERYFNKNLTPEQIKKMLSFYNKGITKIEILEILSSTTLESIENLIEEIEINLKNKKAKLTIHNWLND